MRERAAVHDLMARIGIVRHVAVSVFRESVRDRVLYGLLAFAAALMGASWLIGGIAAGQDVKIVKDVGLAAISIVGLLMALFIGVGLVWKEIDRRSIYWILSKPVGRHEFVVGKFLGLGLTLLVNVAIMTAVLFAVLVATASQYPSSVRAAWTAPAADPGLLCAVALILMELFLVTAIALFFSTFSTPFLSTVLTFGLWAAGHLSPDLRRIDDVVESAAAGHVARALYFVVPNMAAFDVKAQVVHAVPLPPSYMALTLAYGTAYVALLLVAAAAVFSRRDLK